MVPGRFAIPISKNAYYNSLFHTICVESELEQNFLFSGQEEKAIHSRLFATGHFHVVLIPSFECNLRCRHCYVSHLLTKPSGDPMGTTDPEKLLSFIARARSALGPLVSLTIVGGEPFLHAEAFRRYLAAGVRVNTTTNGMFDFENVKDIIGRLFHLTFSIDGWPEQHNHARRALSPGTNPFLVAYRNLCRTIESFPDLDVNVQGSVIDDEVEDFESAFRYYALMLAAGVKRDRISLGPCAATLRRNSTVAFQRVATELTRKSPCCDHVTHKGFYVWNNKIYGSYYRLEEYPAIADLDDSMDVILYNKKQFILNTMPMLQDDVCMRECRAVGLCWGLCTNARHVFRDNKPSSVCDRVAKESKILETARQASVGTHGSCSGCSQPAECETLLPQGLL